MKVLYGLGGILALVTLLIFAAPPAPLTSAEPPIIPVVQESAHATVPEDLYAVIKVIDGDTITVDMHGTSETIRLIGIDTPETVDPRKTVQCFGTEASGKTKSLLTGRKVKVEKDPTQGERDKYDRLLGYVYRDDGLFINEYLVENGYAHEYTYNLPYRYQSDFKAAQKKARIEERGLWAPGVCESLL